MQGILRELSETQKQAASDFWDAKNKIIILYHVAK